jgi:hypothetical protein
MMRTREPLVQRACACGCPGCRDEKSVVLQAKLRVSEAGDIYEREADRIAAQVMSVSSHSTVSASPLSVQRLGVQPTGPNTPPEVVDAYAKADDCRTPDEPLRTSAIRSSQLTIGGTTLPDSVRMFYESRLGYDFGSVRVHTGADAARMTDDLHARAFTYRDHIWLGAGEGPHPSFCLAHELVHVVQQSSPRLVAGSAASARSLATTEPQRGRPPAGLIQRLGDAYWVGQEFFARKGNTGKEIQHEIYASPGRGDVIEEVAIPNAARKRNSEDSEHGLHVKSGFADLYLADRGRQIGVYFDEEHTPHRLAVKKGLTARPVVEGGVLIGADEGPTWVRIGEIKPATASMIRSGKQQVHAYIEGIRLAGRETNAWAVQKNTGQWPLDPLKVREMATSDFTPHPDYTPGNTTSTAYPLVLVEWSDEARTPKVVLQPERTLGQAVQGRLYVNSVGGGVWAYHFAPTNLAALLTDPATQSRLTGRQTQVMNFAQELQSTVIDPITNAPVQAMTLRKSPARTADPGIRRVATPRIQRAPKEAPRLRDTFALEQVVAARRQLRARFSKEGETAPFQKLRGIGLIYEADAAIKRQGFAVGDKLPDESQLSVTLKTQADGKATGGKAVGGKGGTTAGTTTRAVSTLFRSFEIWTHPAIDVLARIRKVFGTTFVTFGTKIRGLTERLATKVRQTFDKHAGGDVRGTSYGAVALRAIGRALKAIGAIIIPQTLRFIVQSLVDGVKAKVREVIPLDVESLGRAVANNFGDFKAIEDRVSSLKDTVHDEITTVVEALHDKLSGIREVISLASKVASIVKWTVRAIQCGTPPAWGCLKLLFSSLTAWIAEKVLSTCSLQREVACLTSGVDFVRTGIPRALASAITDKLNGVLGGIDSRLAPLFAEITDVPSLNCDEIGCEGGRSEMDLAFDRLRLDLEKRHGVLGAAWLMDSLLEMHRLSAADDGDALSVAEIDQLTILLREHNVTPSELDLLVAQMRQQVEQGKTPRKVAPQELMDEIERQRGLLLGGQSSPTEGAVTGEAPSGGTQGPGGRGGAGGEAEGGAGGGLATVDASQAKFDGKIARKLGQTRIVVENPDPGTHKSGKASKVTLVGMIDGESVKRVADVPVKIGAHVRNKGKVTIPYVLMQGVCFEHSVKGVPTFCLDNGTTITMRVTKASRAKPAAHK